MATSIGTNATTIPDMNLIVDEAFARNFWFQRDRNDHDNHTTMVWSEVNGTYLARIVVQPGNTHVDIYRGGHDGPRVFHIELDMTINDPALNATIVNAIAARFDS